MNRFQRWALIFGVVVGLGAWGQSRAAAGDDGVSDGIDRHWVVGLPISLGAVRSQMLLAFADMTRLKGRMQDDVCGCPIHVNGDVVDPLTCEPVFKGRDDNKANVEVVSLVDPASWAKHLACFRVGAPSCRDERGLTYSGQHCCQRIDPIFNSVRSDMNFFLLMPTPLAEVVRQYVFQPTDKMHPLFNSCAVLVDETRASWYLAPSWDGYVSRMWLYAARHYSAEAPYALGVLQKLSNLHPPTAHEIERARAVGRSQQERYQEFTTSFGDSQ